MSIAYKVCGGSEIPAHICDPCINPEKGGIRGAAYIDAAYVEEARAAGGLIDKTKVETLEWWNTAIEAGNIHVIPKTRGTFDGGSPVTAPGYGDVKEIVTGKDFTAVINDPDHAVNEPFYAAMADAPGTFHLAWATGSELRISDKPVKIDPVDDTGEDIDSQVAWAATVTWSQARKTVQVFDLAPVAEIFKCFEVTPDA